MKKKIRVEIIIDESTSMQDQRLVVINGVNEQIDQMRKEEREMEVQYFVRLTKFSDMVTTIFTDRPVAEVKKITLEDYNPEGMTALCDALGSRIDTAEEGEKNVLVYVFTDGQENSSRRFSKAAVQTLVSMRQEQGWGITFYGADMNASLAAADYGILNSVSYTAANTGGALRSSAMVRANYLCAVESGLEGMQRSVNLTKGVSDLLNTTETITTGNS